MSGLVVRTTRGAFKINSPEMGRRRQKLHANSRSPVAWLSQVYDSAFLLFLRLRIH